MTDPVSIRERLIDCGLKITPQRIIVYQALLESDDHPTAENVIRKIKSTHPNISVGTVYRILETFVKSKLISKLKTEKDVMRFDVRTEEHHHLFCCESDRIEDYHDENLNRMLEEYFRRKRIQGFRINDIKVNIVGQFKVKKS
ncbi:MAG: transcriptional repressor [Bacteroidales bacterium]|nr:MAG: transcriptional repressor [Bacteroidales bacterium]